MNKQTTKRSLLASVMALVLCVIMLVGTTFAWFTDTASTGVNKIQAGNLKMEVSYKNTKDGEFAKVSKETPVLNNSALWEPGHVEFAVLKVKNVGTLALKYKLGINIASETPSYNASNQKFYLSDYIQFAVVDGDQSDKTRADLVAAAEAAGSKLIKEGYTVDGIALKAEKDTNEALKNEKTVTLVVWMPESVGNEANYSSKYAPVINLGIDVAATQYNYENDSFGNTYDENAPYAAAASTARELTSAVKKGGYVVLEKDIDLGTYGLSVPEGTDVTINLNGKTVTTTSSQNSFIIVKKGAKLTISGGTVEASKYVFESDGGEIIVNSGNYTAQETVCAVKNAGKLTINGGTFTAKDNCVIATNGNIENAGSEITINGGVFNANIQSNGYIACGVYVANKDTVKINAGTFNVTNGIGVMMRAGNTTIGKDVVINLTSDGTVTAGKVADAALQINVGAHLVSDTASHYPGLDDTFSITNNSNYALVEYK